MSARVHLADRSPAPSGRARGRCGIWSRLFTRDRALVTCVRCERSGAEPLTLGAVAVRLGLTPGQVKWRARRGWIPSGLNIPGVGLRWSGIGLRAKRRDRD